MELYPENISRLRAIPAFAKYAHEKMLEDADFWNRERVHGTGIMRAAAVAICEIGGGSA